MHLLSHLNKASELIQLFKGDMPLANFLKQYFAVNKKHGSKDRKVISHLCYSYFRLGNCLTECSVELQIKVSVFLCTNINSKYQSLFDTNWLNNWHFELNKRIEFVKSQLPEFNISNLFPLNHLLNNQLNAEQFISSHFNQPDLFVRVRPGYSKVVITKLQNASLPFKVITEDCISLPNNTKLDTVLIMNKEVVVQDYSSQQIAQYLKLIKTKWVLNNSNNKVFSVWDCCSASGGKAILVKDTFSNIQLTVSDIRETILHNLKKRFYEAGINNYHSFIADLTQEVRVNKRFDLIICDAPCSGSGTWRRTPEQIRLFSMDKLNYYSNLQKKIINQAIKHLAPNGYFLYITCSVYKNENEEIVNYIQTNTNLKLLQSNILCGFTNNADTMFAALFVVGNH